MTTAPITPELLSTERAAELLSVGSRTLWRWSHGGRAPKPLRIAGTVRYRRQDLLDWIEAGCPRLDRESGDGAANGEENEGG